ncbi:MAG: lysophospholipid acyltransferase family protein [Planctomycetota bacterium]|jgi:KDO2-lipid IV(A) lauroyltransferase
MTKLTREEYKRRKDFWRRLGWHAARPLMRLLEILPLEFVLAAAPALGFLIYLASGRLVRRACRNLEAAFGDALTPRRRKKVALGYYVNAAKCLLEFLHFTHLRPGRIRDLVRDDGFVRMVNLARESGKGCIIIGGHVNNWELLGCHVALHWPTSVVAKRIYFAPFNEAIVSRRTARGYRTVYQDEPPRELLGALRRNEVVGIVPDQDVSRIQGIFVDFFGRPAFTPTAPVSMARVSGAPFVVAFLVREGAAHRMVSFGPFSVPRGGDKEATIKEFTQKWVKLEEEVIRKYPSQWPWIHRRWKTQPE